MLPFYDNHVARGRWVPGTKLCRHDDGVGLTKYLPLSGLSWSQAKNCPSQIGVLSSCVHASLTWGCSPLAEVTRRRGCDQMEVPLRKDLARGRASLTLDEPPVTISAHAPGSCQLPSCGGKLHPSPISHGHLLQARPTWAVTSTLSQSQLPPFFCPHSSTL